MISQQSTLTLFIGGIILLSSLATARQDNITLQTSSGQKKPIVWKIM